MAATSAAARGARVLLVLLLAVALRRARARARPGEVLVWNDEFDVLDTRVWSHLVTASRGFNDEFQYYRDNWRNSYVRDGVLYLQPTLTAEEFGEAFLYNGRLHYPDCNLSPCVSEAGKDIVVPVQSARIRTLGSFGFRYGRLVVRAQLPRGDWLWPAIWLKPVDNAYGPWPRSGEMDLMEARGNKKLVTAAGVSRGVDRVASTLHFGLNKTYRAWRPTSWELYEEEEEEEVNQHPDESWKGVSKYSRVECKCRQEGQPQGRGLLAGLPPVRNALDAALHLLRHRRARHRRTGAAPRRLLEARQPGPPAGRQGHLGGRQRHGALRQAFLHRDERGSGRALLQRRPGQLAAPQALELVVAAAHARLLGAARLVAAHVGRRRPERPQGGLRARVRADGEQRLRGQRVRRRRRARQRRAQHRLSHAPSTTNFHRRFILVSTITTIG